MRTARRRKTAQVLAIVLWIQPAIGAAQQPAAPAATQSVTLDEALRRAQRVQPAVVQAQGALEDAGAARRAAFGAYLPSVTASGSGATLYSGQPVLDRTTGLVLPGGSTTQTLSFGLNASVDVFTGFRRGANSAAARAETAAAESGLVNARYQQRLTTTSAFLDALAAGQLVRVREASVRRAEEQLKVSAAKLRVGSATRADSLQSLVALGTARADLLTAQSGLAAAEAALARQVGADGRVAAVDDSSLYRMADSLDAGALARAAADSAPQVQSSTALAAASRAALRSAKGNYWPTVSLSAGANFNASSRSDYDLINQRQLALQLSWPIFNRFEREQTIVQQESQVDLAEAQAQDARRAVQSVVIAEAAALDAARQRIDIAQTSVAAGTEALRVQQDRYRAGVATIVDVLTAQETLTQAEVDVVSARFDYLRAKAQIEGVLGRHL
ncbi:MAG TPA: TolC family protein [Gemmatimonadales bacterium]|nr:TolC family protein [Gemmatimonadales bacterium]